MLEHNVICYSMFICPVYPILIAIKFKVHKRFKTTHLWVSVTETCVSQELNDMSCVMELLGSCQMT